MNEVELSDYEVHCSMTARNEGRISCETWFYVVEAESAEHAEEIIRKELPEVTIDRVVAK